MEKTVRLNMATGKIKFWKEERGFGFITNNAGGPDCFVHVRQIPDGITPRIGDAVEYDVVHDIQRGKTRADKVRFI